MRPIQNNTRPDSIGQAFIEDRDFRNDPKVSSKITEANSASLKDIFRSYNINLDEYNKKCICPFPFHNKERTPSFIYYHNTNSFYCFGCKSGGGPVNFVSLILSISKIEAADKIIDKFYLSSDNLCVGKFDSAQKTELYVEFSDAIRNFISSNLDDKQAIAYIEKITLAFDTISQKHDLDIKALKALIDKLKVKIGNYNACNDHR